MAVSSGTSTPMCTACHTHRAWPGRRTRGSRTTLQWGREVGRSCWPSEEGGRGRGEREGGEEEEKGGERGREEQRGTVIVYSLIHCAVWDWINLLTFPQ